MTRSPRPLDNPINWSFAIGRLWGITIRVHLFLLFGALWLLSNALERVKDIGVGAALGYGLGSALMLFVIVLVHEFGHCYGARAVGGEAHEVLLWPLGGLAMVSPPHNARAHLITAVCGPIVHPIFCAASAALLVWTTGRLGAIPLNPLHPFRPAVSGVYLTSEPQAWVAYFFGLNYVLLLFNLIPMYPFDGGRIFQALLWPRVGFVRSTLAATWIGMIGAIVLGGIGVLTQTWLALGLAVFGYLTCWQQRHSIQAGAYFDENGLGYDFSQGFGAFREPGRSTRLGYFARRRARKALERERREALALAERRRRVDEILTKVRRDGLQSLSGAERRLLADETQRQRSDQSC